MTLPPIRKVQNGFLIPKKALGDNNITSKLTASGNLSEKGCKAQVPSEGQNVYRS